MELFKSGTIGSWGHQDAFYEIWRYKFNNPTNGYKFIGFIRTVWKSGGLDYHSAIIQVVQGDGSRAPGGGWSTGNDPYDFLPRNGQSYEYNSNDNDRDRDKLGQNPAPWVELPSTSVPATWSQSGQNTNGVALTWITDPNCWTPGNNDLRQGATYTSGSSNPSSYYFFFVVYYQSRSVFFGCSGSEFTDQASISVSLA